MRLTITASLTVTLIAPLVAWPTLAGGVERGSVVLHTAPTSLRAGSPLRDVRQYEATIRRTTHGVAHIEAADVAGLGFGEGYAQAEDHICTIADQVVRARGDRARYFGRGPNEQHLRSDIVMRGLRVRERAAALLREDTEESRQWVGGFAAGYNHYLETTGRGSLPAWCRDQEWVTVITADDVAAIHRLGLLTITNFLNPISSAQPPARSTGADQPASGATSLSVPLGELSAQALLPASASASNGWALGRDLTASRRGMLLANPHYAWIGSNRFWEKHLRIPGKLDVYGVNLIGGLGVLIGFNEAAAWTHTVSAGRRFTLYAIDLVPGDPTRYRYGDEERAMVPVEVTIAVQGEDEPVRHTVWFTHYGPVMTTGPLTWSAQRAFTLRDANEDNGAVFGHLLATGRSRSLAELRRAHAEFQAIPSLTTVAVSADGVAWFADASATPNLDSATIRDLMHRRENDPTTRQLWQTGVVLLNGSDPASEWRDDPRAARRGIVPLAELPQLERTDYVFNANDSYWFAHHSARLDRDHSPLLGAPRTALSLRTRLNAFYLGNVAPYAAAGDGRLTLAQVQEIVLGNRSLAADLLVPELLERCGATPEIAVEGASIGLRRACAVLAAWDRRFDNESRGAVLFREWIGHYPVPTLLSRGPLFAVEFDPADPLTTPRGLAPGALALENLGRAVRLLEGRGIALDVSLGEMQFAPSKLPERIPVHGGGLREGVLNLMLGNRSELTLEPLDLPPRVQGSTLLTEGGYPALHGTSFLMAVEFGSAGPSGSAILTYGQSGDPASEHFTDQTRMFARKEWRPILFVERDIAAGTRRTYTVRAEVRDD